MADQRGEWRDIEAIKQLKARYFRYLDTKQWGRLRGVFTDDARFEGTRRAFAGPDEFVSELEAWLGPAVTVHQGHMPEIVLTGPDTARGVWAMHDVVEFAQPTTEGPFPGRYGFVGFGHYEEEYRRVDGGWRIALLRLTRIRVNALDEAPRPLAQGQLASSGTDWLRG